MSIGKKFKKNYKATKRKKFEREICVAGADASVDCQKDEKKANLNKQQQQQKYCCPAIVAASVNWKQIKEADLTKRDKKVKV